MRWIYIAAVAAVFIRLAVLLPPDEPPVLHIAETIVAEAGVPNSVSGILVRNRLYDTLFELLVFTAAVLGVQYSFSSHRAEEEIFYITDPSMIILARISAMVSLLIFLEMAVRGHLAPGGGFAAGVAGGTALGLLITTGNAHHSHALYNKWKLASLEKGMVMLAFLIGVPYLLLCRGAAAEPAMDGIVIPLLNILIALKVALGSWAVIVLFIRHRGLL